MLKKWGILFYTVIFMAVTGCGQKEPVATNETGQESQQTMETPIQENTAESETNKESDFPVPIHQNGKQVKINELGEISQKAVQWTYDYFQTDGLATEEEFYQMMKAKHYPGMEIHPDIDTPKMFFAGYGSEMLPAFQPGQKVTSIIVQNEVPEGLTMKVPLYIKLAGQENFRGVAIVYFTDEKIIAGADRKFPMIQEMH